ncbi:MAG: glycosyltransferase [Rhodospirillaceae bacterium]|nr:glycosyltransferase [Rhodospirillaceae bacterium]
MIALAAFFGFAAWVYLIFFHRDFWRADQRLPRGFTLPSTWPSVVAVVPARNEAETIGAVVAALVNQNYAGAFRVVVVDDASADGTANLARTAASTSTRLDVIAAPPLVSGWTGKLWALNTGLTHATQNDGPEFFWLTDADIVHPPETLSRLVAKAATDGRDLVSLMVRLRCESFWERRLIPAFIFFFQMLYPFPAANDDRAKTAAAAGGCVLVRRTALEKGGGLDAFKGNIIDDCALAAAVKGAGGKLWVGLADASHSLRRCETLEPLWDMVRRTAFTQLNHSFVMLFLTLLGLFLAFLAPPLAVLTAPWHGDGFAALAGLWTWGGMAYAYAPTLRDYGRSPWEGLLLPLAALLYAGMTFDSGVAHWRQRGGHWKGRNYNPSSSAGNLSESP